ncbi:MAG: aminotransferase class V-fold PLP-dependent enzyme, partial [Clostridia bacterium]|nr:aminotransferase class V-fold PLP-dependent enzyme [Clostridia bacterium]
RDGAAALRPATVLGGVMAVNNEVGSVQPLAAIARILDEAVAAGRVPVRPVLFSDGVQAFGRVLFRPRELGLDAAAVSAHKVHGPKGVGALYLRRGTAFAPLLVGGGQEGGRRAGTENVPGIAGFGAAVRRLMQEEDWPQRLARLRRQLIEGIEARVPPVRLNGPRDEGAAPHIVNLRFPGLRGEVLVHALEAKGYLVSTGSACSSRQAKASHVLRALGLGEEEAGASIRVSFGAFSDPAGVEGLVEALAMAWEELRTFVRR